MMVDCGRYLNRQLYGNENTTAAFYCAAANCDYYMSNYDWLLPSIKSKAEA